MIFRICGRFSLTLSEEETSLNTNPRSPQSGDPEIISSQALDREPAGESISGYAPVPSRVDPESYTLTGSKRQNGKTIIGIRARTETGVAQPGGKLATLTFYTLAAFSKPCGQKGGIAPAPRAACFACSWSVVHGRGNRCDILTSDRAVLLKRPNYCRMGRKFIRPLQAISLTLVNRGNS